MLKETFIFLLIFAFVKIIGGQEQDGYLSLVAPSASYINKPYVTYLASSSYYEDDMLVIVTFREQTIPYIISSEQEATNQILKFNNNGGKKQKKEPKEKYLLYPLRILASQNGKCIDKKISVIGAKNKFHTMIQLDKPFYKPGDEIQFRVIAFDQDTKPIDFNFIEVVIKDGNNNTIAIREDLSEQKFKDFGMYEDNIKLADEIFEGVYNISVIINNDKKLIAEKLFEVKKITLPFFQVLIDAPEKVYLIDSFLDIGVSAKYAFGEYANGEATIEVFANDRIKYNETFIVTSVQSRRIDFIENLNIHYIPVGKANIRIEVSFFDNSTNSKERAVKNVTLYAEKKHSIKVIRVSPFVPGVTCEFSVVVYDYNDQIISSSYDPVKIKYKQIANGKVPGGTASRDGRIKNSVATFQIDTINNELDNNELEIEISYLDTKIVEKVTSKGKVLSEALTVFVKTNEILKGNELVPISVENPEGVYSIVVLVISRLGIVFSKDHYCGGDIKCQTSIQTEEDMLPESKVVVYSFQEYNKEVLFGSTILKFNKLSSNHLSINLGPETSAQPKDKISISLTTKNDSLVSILAIDKKLTFVDKGHDITREDVIKALTNTEKLVHEESKGEDVTFDEKNSNFIIRLQLDQWRECTPNEMKLIDEVKIPTATGHDSNNVNPIIKNEEETPTAWNHKKDENIVGSVRSNFPETWIFDSEKLPGGNLKLQKIVPDSITSWLFTGFSFNKEYGMAIADPQELVVSQDFFIELNLPYSIKYGEVLNLKVIAFNFAREKHAGDMNVKLKVYAKPDTDQQFEFVDFYKNGSSCSFTSSNDIIRTKNIQVQHKFGKTTIFNITPKIIKRITIIVEATATGTNNFLMIDKINKTLIVEHEGITLFDVKYNEFKFEKNETDTVFSNFTAEGEFNQDNIIEPSTVITGDLMGPSLKENDVVYTIPDGCGEQTMSSYSNTLWRYSYAKNSNKITDDQNKEGREALTKGYQNVIKYRNNNDGSYSIYKGAPKSAWLTAYWVSILGHANKINIEQIETEWIEKGLIFCAKYQNSTTGEFETDGYDKPISGQNKTSPSRRISLTSFILMSFLKNRNLVKESHADVISKAFEFIEKEGVHGDNYAAAITAYVAAFDNRNSSHNLLFQLEKNCESDGNYKYWNLIKKNKSDQYIQEIVSSYVALAYLKLNEIEKAKPIIRWLIKKRNQNGKFSDSLATALGIEALATMAAKTAVASTRMSIEFFDKSRRAKSYNLNDENSLTPNLLSLEKDTKSIKIMADGIGYAMVTTYFEYYLTVDRESDIFDLKVEYSLNKNFLTVSASIKNNSPDEKEMIIIEYNFPSGYIYAAEESNPMKQSKLIDRVEHIKGGTLVNLYVRNLPKITTTIQIMGKKKSDIKNLKKASVKVYVYSKKAQTFEAKFYDIKSIKSDCSVPEF